MKKTVVVLMVLLGIGILNVNIQAQENEINFDKVFCYRQIEKQSNVLTITLLVNTKGLEREKTLKIKEKFPNGFQCKIKEGYGSTNAVAENSILFVWSVLPKSELFLVKYELTSTAALNESVSINGNVSFLSETGIKYVSVEQHDYMNNKDIALKIKNIPPYQPGSNAPATVQSSNITVSDVPKSTTSNTTTTPVTPVSENTTAPKPVIRTNVKEEPISNQTIENKTTTQNNIDSKANVEPIKPITEEPVKKENPNVTELPPVTNKTVTKAPNTVSTPSGFYYTVQLGASPKKLPSNYYDKYQFNQPVDELFVDNMYKYSVGKFNTLKEANNYQNYVKQKGLQCFVVAYNDGKKITIKEALAISKQ
ncbi:MAG: hypothetical protein Fur0028_11140 [Bacteroidales bacterium]